MKHLIAFVTAALALAGCAVPGPRVAHTLDPGQFSFTAASYGSVTSASATLTPPSGETVDTEGTYVQWPVQPGLQYIEFRVGLPGNFDIGTQAFPGATATDLKWTLADERDGFPLSFALDLEGSLDWQHGVHVRWGALMSREVALNAKVSLRGVLNATYGNGGMTYRTPIPDDFTLPDGTPISEDAHFAVTTMGWGFHVPVSVEVPIQVRPKMRIVPFIAVTPWFPDRWFNTDVSVSPSLLCGGCTVGVEDYAPQWGMLTFAGVRLEPLFQRNPPRRSK